MKTCMALAMAMAMVIATAATARAQTPDPKGADAGKKVYETQKCSTCHAIKGTGGKGASALDGIGAKRPAADIKKWFTATAEMEAKLAKKPPMSMASWMKTHKLSDPDVEALVAYMLSLK